MRFTFLNGFPALGALLALSLVIIADVQGVKAQEHVSDLIANHQFAPADKPIQMRANCANPIMGSSDAWVASFEAQLCVNEANKTFNFIFYSKTSSIAYYDFHFPILCKTARRVLDLYLEKAGYAAFPGSQECDWSWEPCTDCTLARIQTRLTRDQFSWRTPTDLPLPAKRTVTPVTCPRTEELAGLWSGNRSSAGAQKPPPQELIFATGASGMEGRKPYKAGRDWEADAPNSVTHLVKPADNPGQCIFHASCWDSKGNSRQCAMVLDPAAQSFIFKTRTGATLGEALYSGLRYARGAVANPEASCSDSDIAGNWSRADGARVSITAMSMKDGGRGLMFNAPSQWPAGVFKFSGIKAAGRCTWAAQCATVYRDTTGAHGYQTTTAACTLTLDQSKHRLTTSGPHGEYTR